MATACIFCKTSGSKFSEEHVIPNFLGGRKKLTDIVCAKCNSEFGRTIEAEMSKQLNTFRVLFGLLSNRGETVPPIKRIKLKDGRIVNLVHGGKPVFAVPIIEKEEKSDGTIHINAIAGNVKQFKQIIEGHKRKGEIEGVTKVEGQEYIKEYLPLKLSLGGSDFFRATAKIAFNLLTTLLSHEEISSSQFELIRDYIREGKISEEEPVWYDFDCPFSLGNPIGPIDHSVAVACDPDSHQIVGWVRFYQAFCFRVGLSNSWQGKKIGVYYRVNPIERKDIEGEWWPNDPNIFQRTFIRQSIPDMFKKMEKATKYILTQWQDKAYNDVIQEITKKCMQEVLGNADGRILTEEDVAKLAECVAERYVKFVFRLDSKESG